MWLKMRGNGITLNANAHWIQRSQAPVDVLHYKYCTPGGDSFLSQRLKEGPHIEPGLALPSDNNRFQIKADIEASDCARQTNAADPIKNIGTHTDATCNARRQTPVSSHESDALVKCTRYVPP